MALFQHLNHKEHSSWQDKLLQKQELITKLESNASATDIQSTLMTITKSIVETSCLVVAGVPHKFVEVEIYFHG